jgi:DNA polymerase-3 subunit chi
MGAAYFYHLTRSPVETTLPMLLEKALQAGWRVAVRGRDAARMVWLDEKLWLGGDEAFLPHGLAGGPHDALQPVLLTTAPDVPDATACLMTVDGAAVTPAECGALARVCVVFDGNDPAMLDAARAQWKTLTDAGVPAQYWSEESGRWQLKSEKGTPKVQTE